jgi:hypothetical protein
MYAVYESGYWGNVRCVFHMGSSGPILGIANRYYGYEIRNQVSVEWQRHRFPGIRLHRQQRRYIRLFDSSDNLHIGRPSQYSGLKFSSRLRAKIKTFRFNTKRLLA